MTSRCLSTADVSLSMNNKLLQKAENSKRDFGIAVVVSVLSVNLNGGESASTVEGLAVWRRLAL